MEGSSTIYNTIHVVHNCTSNVIPSGLEPHGVIPYDSRPDGITLLVESPSHALREAKQDGGSKASKSEPATEDQLLEMVEFIKEYPVLISNKPSMRERDLWKKNWEELVDILNNTIEGPTKTVAAWQKEWNLLRNLTKEKMKNIDTAVQVRSPVKYKLTPVEDKVSQLLREDDDSMDTTPIPEESNLTNRRATKRQNSSVSYPNADASLLSVKSPSPAKRSYQAAQTSKFDDADDSNEEFLQDISAQLAKQNECFLKIADAAANMENQCKLAVANNVRILKLIESKFK